MKLAAIIAAGAVLSFAVAATPAAWARQNFDDVEIETTEVADGVYMLVGAGGNLGLTVGEDGAFLIDDQFAPLTEKIRAAVAAVSDQPVRYVINTHWHGDHTGGNENHGEAGAIIVAHDNVRKRLMEGLKRTIIFDGETPPAPPAALPVITFSRDVTFHLNGHDIHAVHVEHAHTDGDAVIFFEDVNVVHMGDVLFNGRYPFIDVESGGSIDGYIAALDRVAGMIDDETRIIPGHGPLATKADLLLSLEILRIVRDRVAALVEQGKTEDEVAAELDVADLARHGEGFADAGRFSRMVFHSLKRR